MLDDKRLNDQWELCIQHLCADTEGSLEDRPGAMEKRDREPVRLSEIHASDMTSFDFFDFSQIFLLLVDEYVKTAWT